MDSGTEEMPQWLGSPASLPEDPSLIPTTLKMAAHKHRLLQFWGSSSGLCKQQVYKWYTGIRGGCLKYQKSHVMKVDQHKNILLKLKSHKKELQNISQNINSVLYHHYQEHFSSWNYIKRQKKYIHNLAKYKCKILYTYNIKKNSYIMHQLRMKFFMNHKKWELDKIKIKLFSI